MQISRIYNFAPNSSIQNFRKNNVSKSQSTNFKGREVVFVSQHSQNILDSLFHALFKAKKDLGETMVHTKGFEVTHKYPNNININMRKYDANTDTLVRLDDTVNSTALQVHIDKFREEESIRFMVQMKDLKDGQGNIHLKKGNVNEFKWNKNFVDYSNEIDEIDNIIAEYLK